jgi:hypothetical protein
MKNESVIHYKYKICYKEVQEQTTASEFKVNVHQYMKILGEVKKLKGVR